MKNKRLTYLSLVTILTLLFQYFSPIYLFYSTQTKAQETEETSTGTSIVDEDSVLIEDEGQFEVENNSQVDVIPETVQDEVTTPVQDSIVNTNDLIWTEQSDGWYETLLPVEVGKTYTIPGSSASIKFTSISIKPEKLSARVITLTDDEQQQLGSISNQAFEFQSQMLDGTFKYNLTLPNENSQSDVKVKYSEDSNNLSDSKLVVENTQKSSDYVYISGLDHFTVFYISADTTGGAYTVTTSSYPRVRENASGQIGLGTVVLNAPTGFEFNTAAATRIRVVCHTVGGGTCVGNTAANNINGVANGTYLTPGSITSSAVTLTITSQSNGGYKNRLDYYNLEIRPISGTPLITGSMYSFSGTASLAGATLNYNSPVDSFNEVAGAVSTLTSTVNESSNSIPADGTTTSTVTITLLDQFSNPISGHNISLSETSGNGTAVITTVQGTTDASGIATFTVGSAHSYTGVYTATDTTDGVVLTDTSSITFNDVTAPVIPGTPGWGQSIPTSGYAGDGVGITNFKGCGSYIRNEGAFRGLWGEAIDDSSVTYERQVRGAVTYNGSEATNYTGTFVPGVSGGASDGTYYVRVRAIDAAGNRSIDDATWSDTTNYTSWCSMTIDTSTPEITFNGFRHQSNGTYDNTQPIQSCGSYNNSGFIAWEWSLNNPGGSPVIYTYTIVSGPTAVGYTTNTLNTHYNGGIPMEGTYVVSVYGTDAAGNAGTAQTCAVTYDATDPTVTVTPEITNDNTPAISGTISEPVSNVTVNINGSDYAASYDNTLLTWTILDNIVIPITPDGIYNVTATAVDLAGNSGVDSTSGELMIDTTAPYVFAGLDRLTNVMITLDGTVDGSISGTGSIVWTQESGSGTVTFGTPNAEDTTVTVDTDGVYTLRLTVVDNAGNSDYDEMQLTWDTTAPVVTEVNRIGTYNNGIDWFTNDRTPDYTFNTSEDGTISYSGDCTSTTTSAVAGNNTITFDTLAVGLHSNCVVTITDAAGNSGIVNVSTFIIDRAAPVASWVTPLNGDYLSGTVNLSANVTDASSGVNFVRFRYQLSGVWHTIYQDYNSPYETTWDTTTVPDGLYTLRIRAEDNVGNARIVEIDVVVDNTFPVITFTDNVEAGPVATDYVVITVADTNPDTNTYEYAFTDGTCNNTVSFTDTYTSSGSIIFNDESHNGSYICAKASDLADNTSYQLSANPLYIDRTAPIITTNTTLPNPTGNVNGTISYTIEASDFGRGNSNIAGITADYGTFTNDGALDSVTEQFTWSWDTTVVPDGTYTVNFCASDANGNVADGVDTTLPTGDPDTTQECYTVIIEVDNLGYIQGRKFNDLNHNGRRDYDIEMGYEPYMSGWTIYLFDSEWSLLETQVTDINDGYTDGLRFGQYRFEDLPAGRYYVCEESRDLWYETRPQIEYPTQGVVYRGFETGVADRCFRINLSAGEERIGVQFGNYYDDVPPTIDTIPDQTFNEGDMVNLGILDDKGMYDNLRLDRAYLTVIYTDLLGNSDTLESTSIDISEAGWDGTGGSLNELFWYYTDNEIHFGDYTIPVDTSIVDEGTYTFNYYVTDIVGNRSDCDAETAEEQNCEFSITINNVAPQVTLNANQTINEGETATFTASFNDPSYINLPDTTGTILEFFEISNYTNYPDDADWTVEIDYGDGGGFTPVGSMSIPGDINAVLGSLQHTYPFIPGNTTYTVTLRVCEESIELNPETDGEGECGIATVLVNVSNNVPVVTIGANPGTTVYAGTAVLLTPTITGGNAPYTYLWTGACNTTANVSYAPSTVGTHTCYLQVTDSDGDTANSSITVIVRATGGTGTSGTGDSEVLGEDTEDDGVISGQGPDDNTDNVLGQTCDSTSKVSGYLYFDKNGNNQKDSDEKGQKDVEVKVYTYVDGKKELVETTKTDENGYWEAKICPGEYDVEINKDNLPEKTKIDGDEVKGITVEKEKGLNNISFKLKETSSFFDSFNWLLCIIPIIILLVLGGLVYWTSRGNKK